MFALNKQNSNQSEIPKNRDEDYKQIIEEFKNQIEEINLKLNDTMNIFEFFNKRSSANSGERQGPSDEFYSLNKIFEQKTFKKFELVDEKSRKIEEETVKNKNDTMNNKIIIEQANKSLNQNKENIDFLLLTVEEIKKVSKIQSVTIEETNQIQFKKIEELIDTKYSELQNIISNNNINKIEKITEIPENKTEKSTLKLEQKLREYSKRLEQTESVLKANNIVGINDLITKITETVLTKTNVTDTSELKSIIGIILSL